MSCYIYSLLAFRFLISFRVVSFISSFALVLHFIFLFHCCPFLRFILLRSPLLNLVCPFLLNLFSFPLHLFAFLLLVFLLCCLSLQCVKTWSNDPMTVFFTSGTTGLPKMAEHTHASYGLGHIITGKYVDCVP